MTTVKRYTEGMVLQVKDHAISKTSGAAWMNGKIVTVQLDDAGKNYEVRFSDGQVNFLSHEQLKLVKA